MSSVQNSGVVVQTVVLGSTDLSEMRFEDLTPIEIPVHVNGTDYVLREADAGAAVAWDNAKMRAAKMENGKLSGFDGVFDSDLVLLSLCLLQVDRSTKRVRVDASGTPFTTPIATIKAWPNRVYKPLVERLKSISPGLEEQETRETLLKQREDIDKKLAEMDRKEAVKEQTDPNAQAAA